MESRQQNRKKTGLLVALALCCILAVGGGVMAWFSSTDHEANVFKEGTGITDPEKKPDPTDPENPGTGETSQPADGNIIEDKWVHESVISADSVVAKNPNVGIGKDSADAYVFVEVENSLGTGTYFVLNKNWVPVDNCVAYDGTKGWASVHGTDGAAVKGKAYVSGLFVYVGKDDGKTSPTDMALLSPNDKGTTGAYTGELFSKVYAGNKAEIEKDPKMNVKAYLVARSNDSEDIASGDAKQEIINAAKTWAKTN